METTPLAYQLLTTRQLRQKMTTTGETNCVSVLRETSSTIVIPTDLTCLDCRIEAKRKSEERSPPEQKKSSCPDASKWGVEDVVKYFSSLGYKDQADALQDQVGPT